MLFINKIFLTGRATADITVRAAGKSKVGSFRLVSNRLIKKQDGSKDEKATYVDCEVWDKRAEYAETRVKKGAVVFVEGRLEMDEWNDKESGQKRNRLKIYVDNMQVDGAKSEDGASGGKSTKGRKQQQEEDADEAVPVADGADLPF
jgi:single-strand DNA-binding protein